MRTSTDGARTVTSPTLVSRLTRALAFCIKATSVDVPPISKVKMSLNPAFLQKCMAPDTPPAGPDINRLTGLSADALADANPPSDRKIERCKSSPIVVLKERFKFSTYLATSGRT